MVCVILSVSCARITRFPRIRDILVMLLRGIWVTKSSLQLRVGLFSLQLHCVHVLYFPPWVLLFSLEQFLKTLLSCARWKDSFCGPLLLAWRVKQRKRTLQSNSPAQSYTWTPPGSWGQPHLLPSTLINVGAVNTNVAHHLFACVYEYRCYTGQRCLGFSPDLECSSLFCTWNEPVHQQCVQLLQEALLKTFRFFFPFYYWCIMCPDFHINRVHSHTMSHEGNINHFYCRSGVGPAAGLLIWLWRTQKGMYTCSARLVGFPHSRHGSTPIILCTAAGKLILEKFSTNWGETLEEKHQNQFCGLFFLGKMKTHWS